MKRSHYLVGTLAIAALLAASSASVMVAQTPSPAPAAAPTFHKDVEPILQKNCQSCHTDRGRSRRFRCSPTRLPGRGRGR